MSSSSSHTPTPVKTAKLAACLIGGIAAAAAGTIAAVILHGKAREKAFSKLATPVFMIPGLDEGFVPQDICLIKDHAQDAGAKRDAATKRDNVDNDTWIFSGYNTFGDPSPLYVCPPDQPARRVLVKLCDGSLYRGHGAAVTAWGNNIYLTVNDGYIVLDRRDVLKAADNSEVYALCHVRLPLQPAFMIAQAGKLYVGEYYFPVVYDTPLDHRLTAPDGTHNPALIFEFTADPHTLSGFSEIPTCAYSIPKEIQGMCCTSQGHIVLSQSFGVGDSHLLVFNAAHTTSSDTFAYDTEHEIPLYCFDSGNLIASIPSIPMTEGLAIDGDTVFMLDESASKRYLLGRYFMGDRVWAFHIPLPKKAR